MNKKHIFIYTFLTLSLIFISLIFFNNYQSKTKLKSVKNSKEKTIETPLNKTENKIEESSAKKMDKSNNDFVETTKIENVNYVAMDAAGTKFEIQAKEGQTDARNYNKIFLFNVKATINLQDSDVITITADSADYNKITVETFFRDNVQVNYINHKVESDKLHLSFQDKLASINENVVYMGNNTKMITDNIEIDFGDKNTKIFMNNNDEKVFVKTIY